MLILWFVENPTSCNWLLNFMRGPERPADERAKQHASLRGFLGLPVSNGLFGSLLLNIKVVM